MAEEGVPVARLLQPNPPPPTRNMKQVLNEMMQKVAQLKRLNHQLDQQMNEFQRVQEHVLPSMDVHLLLEDLDLLSKALETHRVVFQDYLSTRTFLLKE